jgi:hypothetical protein
MNVNAPEKLVQHLLSDVDLLKSIMENIIYCNFSFSSGRKIRAGYFVLLYELATIISDSKNAYVQVEVDKLPKWNHLIEFYIEPIKGRFKEGLLFPSNNSNSELNSFGNFDKHFMEFKPFDQQEKEADEKSESSQKKIPMKELLKQLGTDFENGKKSEPIYVNEKKGGEDMEIINDEDEDNFNNLFNDLGLNQGVNEKAVDEENPEFYNNNYWASNSNLVDESALEDIIDSL